MIKTLHIATAFISISFFITRMFWVLKVPEMMTKKWVKILPHINDTVLLVSAIILSVSYQQYPLVHGWLTAKLIALFLYIILGTYALKRAKQIRNKIIFFILSVLIFAYIVIVAESKSAIIF